MNLNELINKLKLVRCIAGDGQILNEAETMLRILHGQLAFRIDAVIKYQAKVDEQQAEIEALKQIIDANNLSQNIGQFVKPTNEPVAWMHQNPDYAISKHQSLEFNIPLYTHPVKEQDESFDRTASHMAGEYVSYKAELTDEEIGDFTHRMVLCCGVNPNSADINVLGLKFIVEDILRKAQEK
jgi:hypothetical protein